MLILLRVVIDQRCEFECDYVFFVSQSYLISVCDAFFQIRIVVRRLHRFVQDLEIRQCNLRDVWIGRYARNLLEKVMERQANRIVHLNPMTDEMLITLEAVDVLDVNEAVIH